MAKKNMFATQNNYSASACQKSDKQIDTKKEIAKLAGGAVRQKSDKAEIDTKKIIILERFRRNLQNR